MQALLRAGLFPVLIGLGCVCCLTALTMGQEESRSSAVQQFTFEFKELEEERAKAARDYLPFLNVKSLHCGIYCMKAGATDGQQPHAQDEIYYVESGVAKIEIAGKDYDLTQGSIVFVPAKAKHRFHSITEDLKTLVFFSKGPVKAAAGAKGTSDKRLKSKIDSAMTFHASFDSTTDANLFCEGDGLLKIANSVSRKSVETNGAVADVSIAKGGGVSGDCLKFERKPNKTLFYESEIAANLTPGPDWSGSISFWLKLDPNKDLGKGYCDPLQVAGRKWNDGAIWVDFDDVTPRTFRLGVFPDLNKWNPKGIKWDDFPDKDRLMITVHDPPFSADAWTHVAITFADINSTENRNATAKLYLNGKLQGTLKHRIDISWNPKTDPPAAIMLGINYVGGMDELTVFGRDLSSDEVELLSRSFRN